MSRTAAWDRFAEAIPAPAREGALADIRAAVFGTPSPKVAILAVSARDTATRRAEGLLRWPGGDHRFIVETFGGAATALLSWNDDMPFEPYPDTDHVIAPAAALVSGARTTGRQSDLLEKWDALAVRQDVRALLRRHAFDAYQDPAGNRARIWREKIEAIGFRIIPEAEAAAIRTELRGALPGAPGVFTSVRRPR